MTVLGLLLIFGGSSALVYGLLLARDSARTGGSSRT